MHSLGTEGRETPCGLLALYSTLPHRNDSHQPMQFEQQASLLLYTASAEVPVSLG